MTTPEHIDSEILEAILAVYPWTGEKFRAIHERATAADTPEELVEILEMLDDTEFRDTSLGVFWHNSGPFTVFIPVVDDSGNEYFARGCLVTNLGRVQIGSAHPASDGEYRQFLLDPNVFNAIGQRIPEPGVFSIEAMRQDLRLGSGWLSLGLSIDHRSGLD